MRQVLAPLSNSDHVLQSKQINQPASVSYFTIPFTKHMPISCYQTNFSLLSFSEVYSELSGTSKAEIFCENS